MRLQLSQAPITCVMESQLTIKILVRMLMLSDSEAHVVAKEYLGSVPTNEIMPYRTENGNIQ